MDRLDRWLRLRYANVRLASLTISQYGPVDDLRWLLIPDLSQCHYLKTLALRSIGSLGDLTFGAKEERCHAAWIWLVDLTKSVAAANSVTEALFEPDPVLLAEPYAIISLGMSVQYDWMVLSDALNRFAPLASVTVLAPLKKGKAAKTCKAAKGVWTRSGRR